MIVTLLISVLFITLINSIKVLPQVNIDLSASPDQIWSPAMKAISQTYSWEESFGSVFQYHDEHLFNCMPESDFQKIGQAIQQNYPEKEVELLGIQKDFKTYFNQDIEYNYLAAWVYYHELSHADEEICEKFYNQKYAYDKQEIKKVYKREQFAHSECSGVLVKQKDGGVLHGRNMDQFPAEGMRNIAVNMTLTWGNEIIGYSTDIYWFNTGFVTAFVPGLVSLEENYRYDLVEYDQVMEDIIRGAQSQVWPFRDIVENQKSFFNLDDVIGYLLSIPSAAPMYNIIGSVDNGAVLTFSEMSLNEQNPVYKLNEDGVDGWFLVQTNFDLWKDDNEKDNRRTIATNMLKQMGQEIAQSNVGLFSIMDAYSVHNDHTVYTGLMNASDGYYIFFGNDGIKQISAN